MRKIGLINKQIKSIQYYKRKLNKFHFANEPNLLPTGTGDKVTIVPGVDVGTVVGCTRVGMARLPSNVTSLFSILPHPFG